MKKIVQFSALLCMLFSCAKNPLGKNTDLTLLETYEGLSDALSKGDEILVYDVRTAGEYEQGHIPGAINIPVDVIAEKIPVTDKNAFIVVYCRSGGRSGTARRTLAKIGYANIADFGGVSNWKGELISGAKPN